MRNPLRYFLCAAALIACGLFACSAPQEGVKVRIRFVDAVTSKPRGGMVRAVASNGGHPLELAGLLSRLRGLQVAEDYRGWYVVPARGVEALLPRGRLRLEAVSGLDTQLARVDLDLGKEPPAEVTIRFKPLFRTEDHNLVAGNTHLHLMKLSPAEADQYLEQIPAADGLRVLFISYLERQGDDATYVTNRYPIGALQFRGTGVLYQNGEEHRHNFKAYGEGYGHVMFLNLKELVRPVSLGPGITGSGRDNQPLRTGIDAARKQGATVLWCHNTFGFEGVPSALTGRLDALNVFDGSRRGSYEDNYYRYLNIGVRLPLSTGTDWFLYDFSRVYARVPGPLTIPAWLAALKAGRCQATNGPLLTLTVDGREPGQTVAVAEPRTVKIEAAAVGRHDFQSLQLVHNGKVIRTARSERQDGFRARLVHELRIETPGWFALRVESSSRNELGQQLFAHTSPVYVEFQGRRIADVDAALALLRQVEEGQAAIRGQGKFRNEETARRVLALYAEAAQELRKRAGRAP